MGIGYTSDTIRALTHILYDRISLLQAGVKAFGGWMEISSHWHHLYSRAGIPMVIVHTRNGRRGPYMYSYVAHKHTFWTAFQQSMIKGNFVVIHKIGPVVNLVQLTERPEWDIRTQWISSGSDTCWLEFQPGIIKYDLGPTFSLLARRVMTSLTKRMAVRKQDQKNITFLVVFYY